MSVTTGFHSPLVAPAETAIGEAADAIAFGPLRIDVVSSASGTWATGDDLISSAYWQRQALQPVRFRDALETLSARSDALLLEVGSGQALSGFAADHLRGSSPARPVTQALASLPRTPGQSEERVLLTAAARLWQEGTGIDLAKLHADGDRRRVSLPGYPFRRNRFRGAAGAAAASGQANDRPALYAPAWSAEPIAPSSPVEGTLLVVTGDVGDDFGLSSAFAAEGWSVVLCTGDVLAARLAAGSAPRAILDLRLLEPARDGLAEYEGVCALIGEVAAMDVPAPTIFLSTGSASIAGEPAIADRALPLGPIRVAPLEHPGLDCRHIDLDAETIADPRAQARAIGAEFAAPMGAERIAYRRGRRLVERFVPVAARAETAEHPAVREGGTYLLVGGLGEIGLALAERLLAIGAGKLILTGRSLPLADDPRLDRIAALGGDGERVSIEALDATDDRAVAGLARRIGPIDGVVNLAGVARPQLLVARKADETRRIIDTKRISSRLLHEHFDCGLLVLMSSVMAHAPAPGLADYAAANGWLDAFAAQADGAGRVVSIAWDGWDGLGLAQAGTSTAIDATARHPFRIDADCDWRLDEHRIGDRPILPGTAIIELILRVAGAVSTPVLLRDIRFDRPFVADRDGVVEGMVVVREDVSGARRFEVRGSETVQARAVQPRMIEDETLEARTLPGGVPVGDATTIADILGRRADMMALGPRWSALRTIAVDGHRLDARLELASQFDGEGADHIAHPAMVDLGAGIAAAHLAERIGIVPEGAMLLPVGCRELVWFGPLGDTVHSVVEYRSSDGDRHLFDIALFDADGRERLRVEEFTLLTAAPAAFEDDRPVRAMARTAPRGLSVREGSDLFEAALAGPPHANLVACRVPVSDRQARHAPQPGGDASSDSRSQGESLRDPDAREASATERSFARLWADQLGRDGLGLDDNFFELGGNSLDALQIATRARTELGIDIDVRQLFDAPSLRALAGIVDFGNAPGPETGLARRPDGDASVPLAPQQQRLWALNRMDADLATYNLAAPVTIEGPLDVARLKQAWEALVDRHESLRARVVVASDGTARQAFDAGARELGFVDASDRSRAEVEAMVRAFCAEPFDLTYGALARARLFAVAPDQHMLGLVFHHLVIDHWSVGTVYADLLRLYRGERPGEPTIRFGDYAHSTASDRWRRRIEAQLDYWQRRLTGAPQVLELPTDGAASADGRQPGETRSLTLTQETVNRLEARAGEAQASLSMLLLAAFGVLLQRLTGQDRMLIGSPVANRPGGELGDVVGFFANTVALDLRVDPAGTFRTVIDGVRETVGEALANQEAGFEQVVDRLKVRPQSGRTPLFQTMFVLQNAPMPDERVEGLRFAEFEQANDSAKFELTVTLYPTGEGGLKVLAEYRSDLFSAETIEAWLEQYEAVLDRIGDNIGTPLAAIETAADTSAQVEEFEL